MIKSPILLSFSVNIRVPGFYKHFISNILFAGTERKLIFYFWDISLPRTRISAPWFICHFDIHSSFSGRFDSSSSLERRLIVFVHLWTVRKFKSVNLFQLIFSVFAPSGLWEMPNCNCFLFRINHCSQFTLCCQDISYSNIHKKGNSRNFLVNKCAASECNQNNFCIECARCMEYVCVHRNE